MAKVKARLTELEALLSTKEEELQSTRHALTKAEASRAKLKQYLVSLGTGLGFSCSPDGWALDHTYCTLGTSGDLFPSHQSFLHLQRANCRRPSGSRQ